MTPDELRQAEIEAMARQIADGTGVTVTRAYAIATAAHAAAARVREERGWCVVKIIYDKEQAATQPRTTDT